MSEKTKVDTKLYANLMGEVKHRLNALNTALGGYLPVAGPFVQDFCYLQLRLLCELIALACLTAHGDIQETNSKKLRKEYSADKIITALGQLHEDFYPRPFQQTMKSPHFFDAVVVENDHLTKEDLIALYGTCGDKLHRGNLKRILSENLPKQVNFPDIQKWGQKISNLLAAHLITLKGQENIMLCFLGTKEKPHKVQVAMSEFVEPTGPRDEHGVPLSLKGRSSGPAGA